MAKRVFLSLQVHVNAKSLVQVHINRDVLPTFETFRQDHVIPYPSCDWPIQVYRLHYILCSSLEVFQYTYNISHSSMLCRLTSLASSLRLGIWISSLVVARLARWQLSEQGFHYACMRSRN